LCAFSYVVDALPAHCLRRRPGADFLGAAVLELTGYHVNVVRLNLYAADVLVKHGVDRDDFR
jgi:hypothetical protein